MSIHRMPTSDGKTRGSEPLRILPKSIEYPSEDRPHVRPLTDQEARDICTQYNISPNVFQKFDIDGLAARLPSKHLAKLLLIRDAASMETVDTATKVLSEIATDTTYDPKVRVMASKELGKMQKVRAQMSEYLMAEAEKAEENIKKEKPRMFTPGTFNLQVNVNSEPKAETKVDSAAVTVPKAQ
jgi:hypothetical protein